MKTFPPCSPEQMKQVCGLLGLNPESMKQADLQKAVDQNPDLKQQLDHWSLNRTYMFCLKKCGKDGCQICTRPRIPPDVFSTIHFLPDPVPGIVYLFFFQQPVDILNDC